MGISLEENKKLKGCLQVYCPHRAIIYILVFCVLECCVFQLLIVFFWALTIEPGSTRPQRVVLTIILWKPTLCAIECVSEGFDDLLQGWLLYELYGLYPVVTLVSVVGFNHFPLKPGDSIGSFCVDVYDFKWYTIIIRILDFAVLLIVFVISKLKRLCCIVVKEIKIFFNLAYNFINT